MCKAESARQWWLEADTLSVASGVSMLKLSNLPEKVPFKIMLRCLIF